MDFTTFAEEWKILTTPSDMHTLLQYRKVGSDVEIIYNAYSDAGISLSGVSTPLGRLPEGYRPTQGIRFFSWGYQINAGAKPLALFITADGYVNIFHWGANGSYQQIFGSAKFSPVA